MQLSVSTSPAESNLATLLLGGDASADGAAVIASGGTTQPFAELLPELTCGAAGTEPGKTSLPGGIATPTTQPWVGSAIPDVTAASAQPVALSAQCAPIVSPDVAQGEVRETAGQTGRGVVDQEAASTAAETKGSRAGDSMDQAVAGKIAGRSAAGRHGRTSQRVAPPDSKTKSPVTPPAPAQPMPTEGFLPLPAQPLLSPMVALATGNSEELSDAVDDSDLMAGEAGGAPSAPRSFAESATGKSVSGARVPAGASRGTGRRSSPGSTGVIDADFAQAPGMVPSASWSPVSAAPAPSAPTAVATQPMSLEASGNGLPQTRPTKSAGEGVAVSTSSQPVASEAISPQRRARVEASAFQVASGPESATNAPVMPVLEESEASASVDDPSRRFAPVELLARQFSPISTTKAARATTTYQEESSLAPAISVSRSIRFTMQEPAVAAPGVSIAASTTEGMAEAVAATEETTSPLVPFRFQRQAVAANVAPRTLAPSDLSVPVKSDSPMMAAPTLPEVAGVRAHASAATSTAVEDAPLDATNATASGRESTDSLPVSRAGRPVAVRREKIAALAPKFGDVENPVRKGSDKNFLSAVDDEVAHQGKSVGTDVAKLGIDMMSPLSNHPASAAVLGHASTVSPVVETVAADRPAEARISSPISAETTGTAERAVEAVLTAADRFSAGDRHAVNLHFSVGGNDLNVRVELHADEVRAIFHTDSPDLRSALAHEWQAVNGGTEGERSLRFASPVFASNSGQPDSAGLSSFSGGEGSSRQRENGSRRSAEDSFQVAASRTASRSGTETVATSAASVLPAVSSTTSRRFHAHA